MMSRAHKQVSVIAFWGVLLVLFFTLSYCRGWALFTGAIFSVPFFLLSLTLSIILWKVKKIPQLAIIVCYAVLCTLPYLVFILIRIWLKADSAAMTKTMSDLWAYRSNAILNLAVTLLPWSVLLFNIIVSFKRSATAAAFYTALGGFCSVVLCILLGQLEHIGVLPFWGGEYALQKWQDGFLGLALAAFIPVLCAFIRHPDDENFSRNIENEKKD